MTTTHLDVTQTVADWSSRYPSVAPIFTKHQIDLCRDGGKTVIQACREQGIEPKALLGELAGAAQPAFCELGADWENASIGELCDHIETVHHRHLRQELPRLNDLLQKVVETHQAAHPELDELRQSFARLRGGLERHLLTETTVVMPALRAVERDGLPAGSSPEYLTQLLRQLENDHAMIDKELKHMRQVTRGYTLPPNTCATYGAMLDGFWELEWHLHKGIDEEDEILFPRARRRDAALRGA
ncbi:MAG: DUF542 domain-containing protein [Planctomycetes bacterium]|nr:DUF542 domain-containing protein [Planctomycetota bacterium]